MNRNQRSRCACQVRPVSWSLINRVVSGCQPLSSSYLNFNQQTLSRGKSGTPVAYQYYVLLLDNMITNSTPHNFYSIEHFIPTEQLQLLLFPQKNLTINQACTVRGSIALVVDHQIIFNTLGTKTCLNFVKRSDGQNESLIRDREMDFTLKKKI